MFGTVKETGVDDEGLSGFYRDYYPFPLYRDDGRVMYDGFFGNTWLKLTTWNPWRLYRDIKTVSARIKEKKLEGNMVGEGLVTGGIIVFGRDGRARYAYREETGKELPMDDLLAAINAVKADAQNSGDDGGQFQQRVAAVDEL